MPSPGTGASGFGPVRRTGHELRHGPPSVRGPWRTGKDERGVGCAKKYAIAGRFATWAEMEAHLEAWVRDVADRRVHGTTGEAPADRFLRDEPQALRPIAGTPPFTTARDLMRRVGADCAVAVDGNAHSVPWRLIGEQVRVTIGNEIVRVHHSGREVAVHGELKGRHGRVVDDAHLAGLVGARPGRSPAAATPANPPSPPIPGCCQTDENQSPQGQQVCPLLGAEAAPLGKGRVAEVVEI